MLFIAFLAEMRHPWDFWKGLICAEVFIYVCYMFFGLFVYSYQGQYAFNPAMQGKNKTLHFKSKLTWRCRPLAI